jgi:hypothetical protein
MAYPLALLFDFPLGALGVAAAAASVPILIHLLNRRHYRVVNWAAMRFLQNALRKNTRRMRLEQLILLAVRTAVVLLLVGAMASVTPWAEQLWHKAFPGRGLLGAAASRRTHKILVIDGSFSMALKVGDTSCFDRARAAAVRILESSPGGDGFSLVLMASPPRRVVAQPSDDARKVADEVEALRLPHGNADLAATLNAVDDLLRASPEKFDSREVYFLTDLQRSTWTARPAVDPVAAVQRIQGRARAVFVDAGQDGANNLAVTGLTLGAPLATTGAVTPVTATVHNYGAGPAKQVRAELLVGRARATPSDRPFELRVVHQENVDVSPGQTVTLTFPHKFTTPGDYGVQVRLEGDALDLDDTRSAIVSVKDTVPVMLVNGKPAVEFYDRATEWLKDALNPFSRGLVPRQVAARPRVVSESQFADVGAGDLTTYDCIFLCDVARLAAGEVHRLEAHLRRGGGVVFCLGPQVDLEAYNRLLYRGGQGILPARLLGRQRAPEGRYFSFHADDESYRLPPLEAFAGDSDRMSLAGVRFRQYVRAELPPGGRAHKVLSFVPSPLLSSEPRPTAEVRGALAELPVDDPAVVAWPRYRGRVVLVTTTANMDWNTWPISPSFPAFAQELLNYAVAGRLREQGATVGDALEEFFPIGSAGLDVAIHTPDGRTEATRTQDRDETVALRWTDTDVSGVYRATVGQHPREYLFAVNVPAATDTQQASESDLTRTNVDELHAAYPGWDFQLVTDPGQVVHAGGLRPGADGGPDVGTDVARTLLLVMLALLLAEVVLAWRFGHHSGGAAPPVAAKGRRAFVLVAAPLAVVALALAAAMAHAAWTGDFLGFLPDGFRRSVEAALDVPPPTPGEGRRWRLEYLPYLYDAAADPWLAALLGLGAAAAVGFIYLREGKTAPPAYRAVLAGFRVGAVFLTLAVLLPEVRLLFERQSWPDLVILIDDSRSMGTTDNYQEPRVRDAAQRLGALAGLRDADRLQLAKALITRQQPDWLESLLTGHQVKVHVYHCSARAARVAEVSDGGDRDAYQAAVRAVRELHPEGDSSQLGTAVRQVLNDFRGSSLAAVVMLTDGVTTEGEDLAHAARHAAQLGVPLFFIGLGDSHEARDLRLHDLQAEDAVYVNDRIVFELRLTGHGYPNLTVPVTLREKGKDEVLERRMVRVDPLGQPVKVRLAHRPKQTGEKVYVIEVPVQPDQVRPADHNRLEHSVFVRETKLIRVLYVEGYARYEYRFIKNLLERESATDPRNKTVDLRVLLLDADSEYPRLDKSALSDFPSKLELNQYDVVIFGDVDPADRRVEGHLQDLADFVRERGGGFLMVAGERYSPHAFKDTPLLDVLPLEVMRPEPPDAELTSPFRPELTPAGRLHPIFRFSPDEAENAALWARLPALYWWSECYRAKPGAEVLAVHPQRKALPAGEAEGGQPHPLVLQQFVGAGRSLFFGFDETWRWRYRENELHFNQFWIQTVRYLARSRSGRIELRLDKQTPYRRGEPIKLTVRFPDDAPVPAPDVDVRVNVERTVARESDSPEVEGQAFKLAKLEGSRATYEGLLTRTPEGDYRFWLSSPVVTGAKPRAECRVLPPPGEMDRLQMNQPEMERAAQATQGRFYTLADAENLLSDLPPGTRVTLNSPQPPRLLWNHAAVFALAMALLGAEWFLRKRRHLV